MKRLLLFIVFQLVFLFSIAQKDLPLRIELEMAKDASDYNYAPAKENGVFIFYEGNAIGTDSISMIFMHYDTNLRKTYNFPITLPAPIKYVTSAYADSSLYLLFLQESSKKSAGQTVIVRVDFPNHVYTSKVIKSFADPDLYQMKAVHEHLALLASSDKREALYLYDWNTENITAFRADTTLYEIEFCEPDTFNRQFWIGAILQYSERATILVLYQINYEGEIINSQPFPVYSNYFYNSARLSVVDSNNALIIGTYNTENDRYSGNLHTGVYTLPIIRSNFGTPNFYNYTQLRQKDTTNQQRTNKQSLNLQLLVGNLSKGDNQYTLVTEVFYPEYNYNTMNSYDPFYGSYYTPSSSTFAGYRFINSYITTFDKNGKLLWDHYLPFNNILTYRLAQRVSVFYTPENYALIYYPYNFTLTSTIVDGYNIIASTTSMDLETLQRQDVVDYSRSPKIENWYDNYFLVSGSQYIKNNSKTAKAKRYVFFLNKLMYR